MQKKDCFPGGKLGNTHSLSIAERFYLLNVIISSDDVYAVTRAYVLLTGKRSKVCTAYLRSLVSGENYFRAHPYNRKMTEEERREHGKKSRRAYYERNRALILEKQRKRRKAART